MLCMFIFMSEETVGVSCGYFVEFIAYNPRHLSATCTSCTTGTMLLTTPHHVRQALPAVTTPSTTSTPLPGGHCHHWVSHSP